MINEIINLAARIERVVNSFWSAHIMRLCTRICTRMFASFNFESRGLEFDSRISLQNRIVCIWRDKRVKGDRRRWIA